VTSTSFTGPAPDLDAYAAWLRRRGTAPSSIKEYVRLAAFPDPIERMTDRTLSPKYRRLIKAVARSYARFNEDKTLLDELDEVRLPAAVRKHAKIPLPKHDWKRLIDEIDAADYIDEATRAVLGIMATRGLRLGDVLRLSKHEVTAALRDGILAFTAKGERRLEFGVTKTWRPYLEMLQAAFVEQAHRRPRQVWDLIAHRAGNPYKAASLSIGRALRVVGKEAGLEVRELHCHRLRRTVASTFFEICGHDPMKLKAYLQWQSLETAMGYADHVKREDLDAVGEKMFT
jgi:site-specific recombinase XerD